MIMERGSKADEILTLVFMLLAIAAVVCYFAVDSRIPFLCCGGIAVVLRIVQYALRFFSR
jgi:Ca2+/Na+ antiporter